MSAYKKRLIGIAIAVGLCTSSIGLPAIAQTRSDVRQGLPGRRISGGTRGECASSQPVVALEEAEGKGSGASERSSVDFWLPEFDNVYPVEFKLRNSQGNTVYTESLQTGSEARLVSIQIPEKYLQDSQGYHWYFSIICNVQDRSQNIVLSGQLQQQTAELREREEMVDELAMTRRAAK